ncbi:Hypothetical predicted protein, partial [Pelobates cultripes]
FLYSPCFTWGIRAYSPGKIQNSPVAMRADRLDTFSARGLAATQYNCHLIKFLNTVTHEYGNW